FFSSRRRHTRSKRDWSSDVCSSDLTSRAVSSAPPLPDSADALLVDDRRAHPAEEVWATANRLAHLLREATNGCRRRVAVYAENTAEAVIAHLGALRSGASTVAVNAHLG